MSLDETLSTRGSTHGKWKDNAETSQAIKEVFHQNTLSNLTPQMHEALDMIAHKIARILSGDPKHKDHWHDIAGYAQLVENSL